MEESLQVVALISCSGCLLARKSVFYFHLFILELWKKDARGADTHLKAVQLGWEAFGRPKQRRDPPKSSDRICFGFKNK